MRLLHRNNQGEISLTKDFAEHERPPYSILSHCWAEDNSEEVLLAEITTPQGRNKKGYQKIVFCAEQAQNDGLDHFWIDTCCIDKTNTVEVSEAIISMYRWYRDAVKCYVYLPDVSCGQGDSYSVWGLDFEKSKWFSRGWTLQELLAPTIVEFFSCNRVKLGTKSTLATHIQRITAIPTATLRETTMGHVPVQERMRWIEQRKTKRPEDRAYCMFGILEVSMAVLYGEGEMQAFRRLHRELQERSGPLTQSPCPHYLVSRTRNSSFTGRQDLLERLEQNIRDGAQHHWYYRPQCRIVISGLGGQGKSELCVQLAERLRHFFWAVLWIDVSTRDIAQRSFIAAAKRLGLEHSDWEEAVTSIANLQHPWLLVLDNADDPDGDYPEFFPNNPRGVILMTTRNAEFQHYSTEQGVMLQGLTMDEACELLLRTCRLQCDDTEQSSHLETAQRVATLLHSHPLALLQAGAYVAQRHCTLAQYPSVYEQQRQKLLTFRPAGSRPRDRDVYATFEVSAKALEAMNTPTSHNAVRLLSLLAMGAPNDSPLVLLLRVAWAGAQPVPPDVNDYKADDNVALLTPWHVTHLPSICNASSKTWDAFPLQEAVNLLENLALISIKASTTKDAGSILISLHPLVHAWARDRQDQQEQNEAWLQLACAMAFTLRQDADLNPVQLRQLLPHVQALINRPTGEILSTYPVVPVSKILVRCAWYLYSQRAEAMLDLLLDRMFKALNLPRLVVQQAWTGLYELRARSLANFGHFREAAMLLERVVEIHQQTLTFDDPRRVGSQHALARAYTEDGKTGKAIPLLLDVVETRKYTLPARHPDLAVSQVALATAYANNDQVDEAIRLLEDVVEIEKQVSPTRRAAQHNLAMIYWKMGLTAKAFSIMSEVVKVERDALTVDHPDRKVSEKWLAIMTRQLAISQKPEPELEASQVPTSTSSSI